MGRSRERATRLRRTGKKAGPGKCAPSSEHSVISPFASPCTSMAMLRLKPSSVSFSDMLPAGGTQFGQNSRESAESNETGHEIRPGGSRRSASSATEWTLAGPGFTASRVSGLQDVLETGQRLFSGLYLSRSEAARSKCLLTREFRAKPVDPPQGSDGLHRLTRPGVFPPVAVLGTACGPTPESRAQRSTLPTQSQR